MGDRERKAKSEHAPLNAELSSPSGEREQMERLMLHRRIKERRRKRAAESVDPVDQILDSCRRLRLPTPELATAPDRIDADVARFLVHHDQIIDHGLPLLATSVERLVELSHDPDRSSDAERALDEVRQARRSFEESRVRGPSVFKVVVENADDRPQRFAVQSQGRATLAAQIRRVFGIEHRYSAHATVVLGVEIVADGIDAQAAQQVAAYLQAAIGNNLLAQRLLAEQHARIVIVPRATEVMDHPLAAHAKSDPETADAAGITLTDAHGRKSMLVPEEDLVRTQ